MVDTLCLSREPCIVQSGATSWRAGIKYGYRFTLFGRIIFFRRLVSILSEKYIYFFINFSRPWKLCGLNHYVYTFYFIFQLFSYSLKKIWLGKNTIKDLPVYLTHGSKKNKSNVFFRLNSPDLRNTVTSSITYVFFNSFFYYFLTLLKAFGSGRIL